MSSVPAGTPAYEPKLNDFEESLRAAGIAFDEALAPEPPLEAAPVDPPPVVEATPPVVATPPAPPAVVAPPPVDSPDPKLQALIEREQRALEREQAFKQAEPELIQLRQRLDEFEQAKARFLADPAGFVRALAPDADLDSVAKDLWYGKLGPTAQPPEYRATKEARVAQLEVQKLRSELESKDKSRLEEQARMTAEQQESQFVEFQLKPLASAVPDKYHLVKALATQKGPDMAVRLLHDAARMITREGRDCTAEDAAKAVESYLDSIGYAAPAPVAPAPAQPTVAPQEPPSTLRNSHTAVQPTRVPPDENDPRVLRQRGYQAMAAALGDESLARLPVD